MIGGRADLAALKSAARAAIVIPAVFALADNVIEQPQTSVLAAFGSFAIPLAEPVARCRCDGGRRLRHSLLRRTERLRRGGDSRRTSVRARVKQARPRLTLVT